MGGSTGKGPCDIYAAANSNCVAAHSTVRALFAGYAGKLYQVKRTSDSKTQDIGVTADGFADASVQDTFCAGTTCVITFVYDQSGNGNDVEAETADSKVGGNKGQSAANAAQEPFTVGGHKVYSLYLKQSQAYWKDGSKSKVPLGKSPQTVYMVTSGKHQGSGCCFDYALRGGDATSFYKGKLPFTQAKEGAVILGSGGDCCYSNTTLSQGTFYEGAIIAGYPTDDIDDAVQANIVAAQYGK
jgi:hypothetical protein